MTGLLTVERLAGRSKAAPARRRRAAGLCLLAAAAVTLVSGAPAGAAEAGVEDRRIAARWEVTWGGLPIYEVKISAEIADGRFTAGFEARSQGVVEVAAKSRTVWRTAGRVNGNALAPETMHQRYLMKRGGYREVWMTWAPSGAVSTRIDPPENKGKRKKVPEAMQRGDSGPDHGDPQRPGRAARRAGVPIRSQNLRRPPPDRYPDELSPARQDAPGQRAQPAAQGDGLPAPPPARRRFPRARHLKDVPKLHPLKLWIVRLKKPGIWLPVEMALKTRYGIARAWLAALEVSKAKSRPGLPRRTRTAPDR